MADETITVTEGTSPVETLVLRDFRNQEDPNEPVSTALKTLRLIVKRRIDDPDSAAFFDITATLPLGTGLYRFTFTPAETSQLPDTYPGQIRIFNTLTPAVGATPDDSRSVDFVVLARVRSTEP